MHFGRGSDVVVVVSPDFGALYGPFCDWKVRGVTFRSGFWRVWWSKNLLSRTSFSTLKNDTSNADVACYCPFFQRSLPYLTK